MRRWGDSKTFIPLINVIITLLIGMMMTGCFTRTITITPFQAEEKSIFQLPLSVRVELKKVEQENPNPVTPIFVDRASLKETLITYLNTRNIFHSVFDGLSDSIMNVNVRYSVDTYGSTFKYSVIIKASLTSKDGLDLGAFSGQGIANGGMSRFSTKADSVPINKAMKDAIEDLCLKIESNRPLILSSLGHTVSATLSEKSLTKSDDIDNFQSPKSKPNKNFYAIVIGIEQYRQKLPRAEFAVNDAKLMSQYLSKVLGYPEENIVTLTNDYAALGDFVKYFEKWLPNNVEQGSTVFIYYSGHGAPNPKTGDAYIVPYDGDPSFIDQTGYSLKRMYDALKKLPAKQIIVALDSCFSGAGGRSVLAKGARPLVMNLQNAIVFPVNMTVMTAASGDQISSTYDEKGHGLFTYFMLKGIKDEDVMRPDGSLKIDDLYSYIKPQVERIARKQYNNEQTPQLIEPKKN